MEIITAQEAADIAVEYNIPETFEERMQGIYERIKFDAKCGRFNILMQLFLSPENVEVIIQELTSKGYDVEKDNPRMDSYYAEISISW
jgi:hypothetical protein